MQLSELKKRIKGVMIVQTTPFNSDGSLDLEGMRNNTRWLLEHTTSKDFIFTPLGSTGEAYAMSLEERQAVIKTVVEEVRGRSVIMAGAGRAGTRETVEMVRYAQSVGADGAMVVLPYYHIPEEEGMYLHYKQVAESVDTDFGIMVYNNAGVSGSWVKPHLMKKLSKIHNIIAVKENTLNAIDYYAMRTKLDPEDAVILCGQGELMFSFEALYHCPGFISMLPNFAPNLSYSVYEAAVARDFDQLYKIIDSQIKPYNDFLEEVLKNHGPHTGIPGAGGGEEGAMTIGLAKAAMDVIGLRGGEPRLPLVGLNNEEKTELGGVLKVMNVI